MTGHLSGFAHLDLDDLADPPDVFFHVTDTYDDILYGRLYEAYVDVHAVERLDTLRLGRQMLQETPELVWFDGLLVESPALGERDVRLGAYGGKPVHVYESSPSGDAAVGVYALGRPWKRGRVRLDWLHLEDDDSLGEHEDDLFGAELWQGLGERLQVYGSYSRLDSDDRDWRARGTYVDPHLGLLVQVSYYELLSTLRDRSLEVDPFFSSLRAYSPFRQAQVLLSKDLGERLVVEGGADVRRLSDEDDENAFNHEYERYHVTATAEDLVWEDLVLSLTGELWEGDRDDVRSWGADLSREFRERYEASVGTYYSLYKYDLFDDRERDDVQTYYARLEYARTENVSFDLEYAFEDDDLDSYHSVRVGASWRF